MATPTSTTILALPNEILDDIAECLDLDSLSQLVLTCRVFFNLFDRKLHEYAVQDANSESCLSWVRHDKNWLHYRIFPPTDRDRTPSLRKLIDHGLDVNRTLEIRGFTWLMAAVCMNNLSSMRVLLEQGADVSATGGGYGTTVLHVAACRLGVEAVTLLLQFGADPKAINERGKTPLDIARSKDVIEVLKNWGEQRKEL